MTNDEMEYIKAEVTELFSYSLEMFSFEEIIDCSEDLTDAQKEWAKKNLDWKVVFDLDNP